MARETDEKHIKPNLKLMQPELLLNCKALGVAVNSAEIEGIRQKAVRAGIATTVCSDKVMEPGRLLININGDPQIAELSKIETDMRKGIKDSEPFSRLNAMEARQRYRSAVADAASQFQLLLEESGVAASVRQLQLKQVREAEPVVPRLIQVIEKPDTTVKR